MNKLIFSLLFAMIHVYAYTQNSISGTINNNQEPLEGASIYIPKLEKGGVSNINGKFTINNLPKGDYKIVISKLGYSTYSQTITLPYSNTLVVQLEESAIEMQEVVVSTPFHKLQKDNVMKVERQSNAELKNSGAITLAEGITNIPGVNSITTGTNIGKPVIRGLSSNRVLVYTQGVRLENQQFGGEHGLGLSGYGIESVEVIKGPASLLYGSDAIGGVLYINPEKFAQSNTWNADINGDYFSNTEGYGTNMGYKSSTDNFKFLVRGGIVEHSDYKTDAYRATNTRSKIQDFKAGIGYQTSKYKTDFRYNVNLSQIGIPEEIGDQTSSKELVSPYQDVTNHVLSSKTNIFFPNSSLEVSLGYIYNDRKEFEDEHHHEDEHHDEDEDHEDEDHEDEDHHDEDEEHDEDHEELHPALYMKLQTFNYNIKYNLPKLGKLETIIGIQGLNQRNANYGEEVLIPNASTNDIGILATSHIHFDRIDVQLGARFDNRNINVENGLNNSYNSFNGAFGFKTNLTDNFVTRVNFASGFRAPNLAELTSDGVHHGSNRYEIGNADLENEQNFQVDVNFEFTNEHVEFFANGFYNTINNYIFLLPNGTEIESTPVFNYVQDNANLYGGEVGLHFHPHPLDWLHFESSFETVTGKLSKDDYLPLIPANNLKNTLRVEFNNTNKSLENLYAFVTLKSVFKQGNVSTFESSTNGYNLLDLGLGGTFAVFRKKATGRINASNLLDKTYISHLSRLKSDNIANMGRNISFGLTVEL